VRVFVVVEGLNMHGSFDALAGAVRSLGLDPVDGHVYVFFNRRRRIAKALWFDGSGWCVLAKRLEAGTFQLPPLVGDERQVQVDGTLGEVSSGRMPATDSEADRRAGLFQEAQRQALPANG
jgi:transposase